ADRERHDPEDAETGHRLGLLLPDVLVARLLVRLRDRRLSINGRHPDPARGAPDLRHDQGHRRPLEDPSRREVSHGPPSLVLVGTARSTHALGQGNGAANGADQGIANLAVDAVGWGRGPWGDGRRFAPDWAGDPEPESARRSGPRRPGSPSRLRGSALAL